MSKRIHSQSIGPTDGWQTLADAAKDMKLVTITAVGGDIGIRDHGSSLDPGQIVEGASVAFVDVDLSKIEINVPGGASASVLG